MQSKANWCTEPCGHTIIDGLWDESRLMRTAAEFPSPDDPSWITYTEDHEHGKQEGSNSGFWGPEVTSMLTDMQALAPRWADLAGTEELSGDTNGGGMHLTGTGGRLAMHRDFSYHPETGMERRLNMLVFLNQAWERDWGGVLYLGENREIEVMPLMNRTVVFECSDRSWHGHPEPIVGDHWRKSLACYFYSAPRGSTPHHGTAWL